MVVLVVSGKKMFFEPQAVAVPVITAQTKWEFPVNPPAPAVR